MMRNLMPWILLVVIAALVMGVSSIFWYLLAQDGPSPLMILIVAVNTALGSLAWWYILKTWEKNR